ncbi:MAG: hypothetical protein HON98_02955 [Chloroflexi bacterium]|jgi:uncharacterized protein YndB with AHSA1/START domain|nr:hypothetical protein [Chloroflexota bacterium]MBT3670315.1 hypothetical protein [Chloroflexota bacterium]MBT4002621.1 hypothetical protein [Chloroflexota bacterium]MBT4305503.1 hypothetical protein [Chloroflexota bacterium]MBT4533114.1 hypothetical protein [Chloroflexota bacterium]
MDSLHQVEIKASPEAVFKAITEQEGIASWWSEHTKAEAKEGFVNEVSFYGGMYLTSLNFI